MTKNLELTRRHFVTLAAGAAIITALPRAVSAANSSCATETLKKIGEIVSTKGKLKGVLKIKNGPKALPGYKGSQLPMMRYFEGYDQQAATQVVWPPDKQGCNPGPTLRVGVGERVELTFLNQVDVGAFPGGTLDNAETGNTAGCDQATNATLPNPPGPDKNWYPGTRGDTFPNCFHGSSTANLHFHGTHVTPDGFGDNVLVQIRPDPNITEQMVEPLFNEIFADCEKNASTPPWSAIPKSYRDMQQQAVRNYDLHAIWKGTRGPVKDSSGKDVPALPLANQLTPANDENIAAGLWPQYFVGAFPNCFRITEANGHLMGQAPGTHWYHSHKHGSTSINLYNGLAGALIIEGDYDKELANAIPDLKANEKVIVVQDFTDLPNLERPKGGGATKSIMTNGTQVLAPTATVGQQAPAIVMRPGQIQLWRIINAQVENVLNGAFASPPGVAPGALPLFRQTAQDGVQFNYDNYNDQPLTTPDANHNGTKFTLVAGGRIDILVQAPLTPGNYELSGIVNVIVCGDAFNPPQPFPDSTNFGASFPKFLGDLPKPRINRTLAFDWEPFRINIGAANATAGNTHSKAVPFDEPDGTKIKVSMAPIFAIDGEQFAEHRYYQTMILNDEEEWLILNNTIVPHPFHIHVNPFQVIETYDPNPGGIQKKYDKNGVWQDVIAIPSALKDANGKLVIDATTGRATTPGYIRVRSRFVDFTGSYVLHCHILGHEDRGMMQLVRVIDGRTKVRHH